MKLQTKIALELERIRRHNLVAMHPLQQLFWESTMRCNVACRHCGSDCKTEPIPDPPIDDLLQTLDNEITPHVDPHHVLIIISGGEPLMRTDLEEIGKQLYQREYPWGFVTNGLALTPERFKNLRRAGLRSMSISLDGTEEDHIWMRRHKLAYRGAIRAIELAVSEDMTFDVVTCVNQHNFNHLAELRDLLISMGVKRWRTVTIDPMGRAENNPELQLDNRQFEQLLSFIQSTRNEGKIRVSYGCSGFLGNWEGQVRDHLYHCAAGVTVASILIDGSISACTSIRGKYYQGNIHTDHFWEVWQNKFQPYRNRQWMKKEQPCSGCSMWKYCEGNGMHLRREDGTLMRCHLSSLPPSAW